MQKRGQHLRPKVPKRTKKRAQQAEIQHHAAANTQEDVNAKLSLCDGDRIAHRAGGHGQAEQQVAQYQ